MDEQNIRAQLIQDLGIATLPEEAQNEILETLGQNTIRRVTLEILKQIPEEKHAAFDEVTSTGDAEQINAFIADYIPNPGAFVQAKTKETIEEFKALANI